VQLSVRRPTLLGKLELAIGKVEQDDTGFPKVDGCPEL
jgi:hypothetical protein